MEGMYYGGGPKPEEDADVDIGNLLEQTRLDDGTAKGQSILSSLMAGGKDRGLNLIQEDFPATPSAMYGHRGLFTSGTGELEGPDDPSLLASALHQRAGPQFLNSGGQNGGKGVDTTLEASMQNLYIAGESPRHKSQGDLNGNNGMPPLGVRGRVEGAAQPAQAPQQQQPPPTAQPAAQSAPAQPVPAQSGGSKPQGQTQPASQPQGAAPAGPPNQQQMHPPQMQQQQMHQQPPAIAAQDPRQHPMPMMPQMQYVPVDQNGIPAAQPGMMPGGQGQPGAPGYYMQQPVFLDQNGQPIYYRGPEGFQQQVIYTQGPDGQPTEQIVFIPSYPGAPGQMPGPGGYMPYPGMPPDQYQQGADPSGMRRMYPNMPPYGQMGMMPGGSPPGGRGFPMQNRMGFGRPGDMDMYGRDNRKMDHRRDKRGAYDDRDRRRNGGGGVGGGDYNRGGASTINPMRDPLVDEFRSTYGKSRQWELGDLDGHVVAFCQDQHGSRFIQQRLEVCTEPDKQKIFDEIMPSAHSLMTDVFGNYVLQKLFEYGTPDQCETLALLLTGQCVQLSMQMYGCRVVQKALEYVSTQRLIALVTEFEDPQVLVRCVYDSNGNHVIQKCIEIVSRVAKEAATPELSEYLSSRIMFIINTFQGRVKELSSHPYGCRVVQRILEHCSNPQKAIILEGLRKCCSELVQDCYGNYVIQFVMQHGWEADRAVLIKEVQSHLLDFSQHKFASNVVEKCLQYASKRDRDEMIWTIINVTFDLNNPVDAKTGHCVLESMVRDPYANYVVQKVIDVSDERQRAAIVRYVRENIVQLKRYTYGKHIIVRLEKITNEKF